MSIHDPKGKRNLRRLNKCIHLSIQFLRDWDKAAATSSESPGATHSPDARTANHVVCSLFSTET